MDSPSAASAPAPPLTRPFMAALIAVALAPINFGIWTLTKPRYRTWENAWLVVFVLVGVVQMVLAIHAVKHGARAWRRNREGRLGTAVLGGVMTVGAPLGVLAGIFFWNLLRTWC